MAVARLNSVRAIGSRECRESLLLGCSESLLLGCSDCLIDIRFRLWRIEAWSSSTARSAATLL